MNDPSDSQAASAWVKPLPKPDHVSEYYWRAASEGRLVIQHCPACGHRQWYPRALCTNCAANPEWLDCAGTGAVHTFTVIRQMGGAGFSDEVPYVVAMIELPEGPRVMGNIIGAEIDEVHIDMAVQVVFVPAAEDIAVPQWMPLT